MLPIDVDYKVRRSQAEHQADVRAIINHLSDIFTVHCFTGVGLPELSISEILLPR
jgi:hypothetical protein